MNRIRITGGVLLSLAVVLSTHAVSTAEQKDELTIQKDQLGSTPNVTRFGKTLFSGQPDPEALEEAKKRGIKVVLTVRQEGEVEWDEAAKAQSLGLEFCRLGFRAPESLTDDLIDQARKVLVKSKDTPTMVHCGSANRVGAIWMAYRAVDGGLSIEEALAEGKQIGLRNKAYVEVVKDYIQRHRDKP